MDGYLLKTGSPPRLAEAVRGILEQLRDNTEEALSLPEPEHLERGRKLSSQALEIVRCIIREIRGGIEHGL